MKTYQKITGFLLIISFCVLFYIVVHADVKSDYGRLTSQDDKDIQQANAELSAIQNRAIYLQQIITNSQQDEVSLNSDLTNAVSASASAGVLNLSP